MARRPKRDRSQDDARCGDHGATSTTRCAACGSPLCDACFRFRVAAKPSCARCAYVATTWPARRVSLAVSFLSFSLAALFWASRRYDLVAEPAAPLFGGLAALVVALLIALSGRREGQAAIERRDPDEPTEVVVEDEPAGGPYRARAGVRRVLLAAAPRVSGSATALVVLASLAAAGVLLPASLRLPRWVEGELVLLLWWAIVAVALAVLLYRGFRLRDDYVYFAPWDRPKAKPGVAAGKGGGGLGLDGCGDLSGLDGEGCVAAVVVVAILGVALGAAWLFVELVMPVVFLAMYWLFMRAITRVARDHRDCEGDLGRSVGWAALWAAVYVTPVALLVWGAHVVHHV